MSLTMDPIPSRQQQQHQHQQQNQPPLQQRQPPTDHDAPSSLPVECNDDEFLREVLHLDEGLTETLFDLDLVKQAEALGITIAPSPPPTPTHQNAHDSMCESAVTTGTSHHARTTSSGSRRSTSTGMTSRSSNEQLDQLTPSQTRNRSATIRRSLSFSEYEKYIVQTGASNASEAGFTPPPIPAGEPAPSIFSVSTRRSFTSIRSGFKKRFKLKRTKSSRDDMNCCVCCRESFRKVKSLHTLPCQHNYCDNCLHVLASQATSDESKMPPRCCTMAIPAFTIKSVLNREEQQIFMKALVQFSTPWEARIFCPNPACREFIPKRQKIDPKRPFEVNCRKCRTSACSICKGAAHAVGQDCPGDLELEAVLKMGQKAGWRRCYKCRALVELTQGCSHITCRCKAQFCYLCGAVWDPVVGCPNYCSGEEELERRREEEEARAKELEAEKHAREQKAKIEAIEIFEAEMRTRESPELNSLAARQVNERDRLISFERQKKWFMWTRQGAMKLEVLNKYTELQQKMRERHERTANHLEDRQVGAEMELRATLKQSERSVHIRLKHMEAYCHGLGMTTTSSSSREVTERDLRELGQQYNIRDDLERLHQAKINVMRDKQAKQMEQLLMRQDEELEKLAAKQDDELLQLEEGFAVEDEAFNALFTERKKRMSKRWQIVESLERTKLQQAQHVEFAPLPPLQWPRIVTEVEVAKATENAVAETIPENSST